MTNQPDHEIIRLRDDKIADLEEKIKKLSMTACVQERLNEWRSKYFTKVIFRLKPSENPLDVPAFTVVGQDDLGIAKQMVISSPRAPNLKVTSVCVLVSKQGNSQSQFYEEGLR